MFLKSRVHFTLALSFFIFVILNPASLDCSDKSVFLLDLKALGGWKRIGTFPPTFTSLLPPLFDKHSGCYGNDLIDVAEKPKILKRFWQAARVLSETAVKQWRWKDWPLPGLITSLRDKRSSWCKYWISVRGHISLWSKQRKTYGSPLREVTSKLLYRG